MTYFLTYSAIMFVGVTGLLISVGALHDIAFRTVPNGLSLGVAVLGVARGVAGGGLLESTFAAAGVFILAILCWRFGWLGGGDAKLLAAASLGMPATSVPSFIVAVAFAGGALALVYLATRSILPCSASKRPTGLMARIKRAEHWRLSRGGPLPYACAIACGFMFAAH